MEMEEKEITGRRAAPRAGKKTGLIVAGAAAGVLAAVYLGLCAFAAGETLWPHTDVMGVDLSGLTAAQAEEKLSAALPAQLAGRQVTLYEPGSGQRVALDTDGLVQAADLVGDVDTAARADRVGAHFLTLGGRYLARVLSGGGVSVAPSLTFTSAGEARIKEALEELSQKLGIQGNETTYEVTDTALLFHKGVTGTEVDGEAVRQGVGFALCGTGPETVEVKLIQAPPAEPDFDAIHEAVSAQVADAYLDRESRQIVPAVTGVDFDVEAARLALEQTADGQTCRVALTLTEPKIGTTAFRASLFRDTLGSAVTKFSGTSARKDNIALAASFIHGYILFPGEEFSYNALCGPYETTKGYGKAGAYVNGKTVDTTAGGICQLSSTLYWATLKSNLEVTERHCHRYEPSYLPSGMDATVYGSSLDYRFQNNTEYPLKVEAYVDSKNYVHVTLLGTNGSGIHAEPYNNNRTVTQYAQTVYEPSAEIPQGTTQKDPERTAYNAVTVEVYQKLVDASGNTVDTVFLHKDSYKMRNAVILYNPADQALWGIDPATGLKTLAPVTPTPEATPTSTPAPSATGTPAPSESQSPAPTAAPAETVPVDPNEPVLPPEA